MYVLLLGVWSYPAGGVGARVIKLIAKVETSRYFIKRRLCQILGSLPPIYRTEGSTKAGRDCLPKGQKVGMLNRTYTLAVCNVYLSQVKRIRLAMKTYTFRA